MPFLSFLLVDEIGAECFSKSVDLLCTISLSDTCFLLFCTLTLDKINQVSQPFWLFVSFSRLVDEVTGATE